MLTRKIFDYIKNNYSVVSQLSINSNFVLNHPKLDVNFLQLQVYSDVSYATSHDKTSLLGYLIFMVGKVNQVNLFIEIFTSQKGQIDPFLVANSRILLASFICDLF